MLNILVTGGAGYIGSHTALRLVEAGHQVVVLDNLYSGHQWAIPEDAVFCQGSIQDRTLVRNIIKQHNIDSVVHFAGHVVVPESVSNPSKYYMNNVVGSFDLIETCIQEKIPRFVFSSSAAVYGVPNHSKVDENIQLAPINPYGRSKLITEWTLEDLAAAAGDDFQYVALRYFNVAGAHTNGRLGQATPDATHLIKVACETACKKRSGMSIFGSDYDTPDGSCIRDYIHIEDLAEAHLDAFDYLREGGPSTIVNCGYGRGFSVKEVIQCIKEVSKTDFPVSMEPRRVGDPPHLIADNTKIKQLFNWHSRFDDLELICRTAYEWEKKLTERQ